MEVSDAKRLRAFKDENRRLKEMVADLSLDKEALQREIPSIAGKIQPCARWL